jgi:hypothetical protein
MPHLFLLYFLVSRKSIHPLKKKKKKPERRKERKGKGLSSFSAVAWMILALLILPRSCQMRDGLYRGIMTNVKTQPHNIQDRV